MSLGANVAELDRLLIQLNVKAALWVGNGDTAQDRSGRAQDLVVALEGFISDNLDLFGSGPADCSGSGCHWDDNLQMCVCNILFAETAYQMAAGRKAGKGKTSVKAKPKSSPDGRKSTKVTRRPK